MREIESWEKTIGELRAAAKQARTFAESLPGAGARDGFLKLAARLELEASELDDRRKICLAMSGHNVISKPCL